MSFPNPPKVDPRVVRTRGLLQDAFRALMAERPSCDMSVGEVAERASVSRATFYSHFEDMRHLATTVLRDDLKAAMRSRVPLGTPITLQTASDAAVAVYGFFDVFFRTKHSATGEREVTIAATLQETVSRSSAIGSTTTPGA